MGGHVVLSEWLFQTGPYMSFTWGKAPNLTSKIWFLVEQYIFSRPPLNV